MRHIDDGVLRRLIDDPLATPTRDREHLKECSQCRARFSGIERDARAAREALARPAASFDTGRALAALRPHLQEERIIPVRRRLSGVLHLPATRPVAVLAAVAVMLTAVVVSPAGSLAQNFITIFQPAQVTAVPVTMSDLRSLAQLSRYGTYTLPKNSPSQPAANAAAASQASGMTVLVPGPLPSDVTGAATYQVLPSETGSFTFSAAKAQKVAAKHGKTLPRMPASIDGSTLQVTSGNAVVAVYGQAAGSIPSLVIGQMRAPTVTSSGVSVKELEDYVLSLPGISPQLAQSIRAIGDPSKTLPVPVPVNFASAQSVTVQGVQGLTVGDSTGVGSVVIWVKDGIIYGVGGTLTQGEALDIANSLH